MSVSSLNATDFVDNDLKLPYLMEDCELCALLLFSLSFSLSLFLSLFFFYYYLPPSTNLFKSSACASNALFNFPFNTSVTGAKSP